LVLEQVDPEGVWSPVNVATPRLSGHCCAEDNDIAAAADLAYESLATIRIEVLGYL
jgi:hypothetical protein